MVYYLDRRIRNRITIIRCTDHISIVGLHVGCTLMLLFILAGWFTRC